MKWRLLQAGLIVFVAINWGSASYIAIKAHVAQWLIEDAWAETLVDGKRHYPWPWADSWPVARLRHANADLYVLAGAHGTALAFGPGHLDGSDLPGRGHAVIGGHRDTHFSFLREIKIGAKLQLQTVDGHWQEYVITARDIVDTEATALYLSAQHNLLQLITCYPFDTLVPGGPLRLSVIAIPISTTPASVVSGLGI